MTLQIDQEYITKTLVDLVQIDSVNPSLIPDGGGEAEVGAYVAKALTALGLTVTSYDLGPRRANVFGVLPGTGGGRSLLLNAHMDTVGVDGMVDPFSAEIRAGRLYGRGSQDMKGSLAAMLGATRALIDGGHQLAGDLLVTAVADEEYLSIGMQHLVKT
ncbi:MAG: M20 family metallopeptidase, partial [Candidatus Promineifilaceae bacterium]